MKYIKLFEDDRWVNNKTKIDKNVLRDEFKKHFNWKSKEGIDEKLIPTEIKNKFHEWNEYSDYLYAGVPEGTDINHIKSWTTDNETAKSFSKKYKNGIVIKLPKDEFKNKFNFVSMDILDEYLGKSYTGKSSDTYISESEVLVLSKKKK